MPIRPITLLFALLLGNYALQAQVNRYLVLFKDKSGTPFSLQSPLSYLSQKALDRRAVSGTPIDSTDLPVNPQYLSQLGSLPGVQLLNASRWLNQVSVFLNDPGVLPQIESLPFVMSARPIASRTALLPVHKKLTPDADLPTPLLSQRTTDLSEYGASGPIVRLHQADFLHQHGFRGEPMVMAIMDAGFYNYDILPTFDSIRNKGQIRTTWDFVAREASVSEDDSHGMHCLSTIAANMPGVFVGMAPNASFHLFRTEDVASEYPIEEHNLAVATEQADSLGVDICSISLGYTTFDDPAMNYSYADMNGNTTISARAMDLASRKGMLIVAAAGNEGGRAWRYIVTPADGDSVVAVAAVDTLGNVAGFSSYGPAADGQIKPDLASVGRNAIVANTFTGQPVFSNGTSFACPNLAGLSACLWQAFPLSSNMDIQAALRKSATLYDAPNDRLGYGIPDMKKAFVLLQRSTFQKNLSSLSCRVSGQLSYFADSSMTLLVERRFPGETDYSAWKSIRSDSAYGRRQSGWTDNYAGSLYNRVDYRFRMQIGTDTAYVMDSLTVFFDTDCRNIRPDANTVLIRPVPFRDELTLTLDRNEDARIVVQLFGASGQKVFETSYNHIRGTQTTTLPLGYLARGSYVVRLSANGQVFHTRTVVRQ